MLSEKAQKKYVFFEESNMKAVFDQPEAFEALVAAAGAAQQSGEPFAVPQDLPEGVECGVVHVSESISFVEVTPEEIDSDVVVIYYHGGGFIMEMGREHLVLCSVLAKGLKCRVIAPFYPCMPTATCDDTFAAALGAYQYVLDTYPGSRVVLMGDSSGGQVRLEVAEGLWHAFLLDALCDIPEVDLYVDKVLEAIGTC